MNMLSVRGKGKTGDSKGPRTPISEPPFNGERKALDKIHEIIKTNGPLDELIRYTLNIYPSVKKAAICALEKRNGPEAVDAIISALNDANYEVRQTAVRALKNKINDPKVREAVEDAMDDKHPYVRLEAKNALKIKY
ncbi:HEAT repeat domain-containing protein [Candidatus Micrarchaeota archaeon]|nr:HEAT repeat domain-containing protein [Candidatus Micrarchaeota archaeon]